MVRRFGISYQRTKPQATFFNFGQDWKTDFTIKIAGDMDRLFPPADIGQPPNPLADPRVWKNRTVRVRGYVVENNGPMIELTHPEQIDFLKTSK